MPKFLIHGWITDNLTNGSITAAEVENTNLVALKGQQDWKALEVGQRTLCTVGGEVSNYTYYIERVK
jgi:hypothetical protein